ncbi:hypothetical protein Ae706Ps2_4560c [Pseudonocardia sp. Ae706_Ps2]|nr:hypothetical protein Ae706Ps2_4560c [Pseudonocardia sp. Ae706_Ps2]
MAGHSVDVLLRGYAKCIVGQEDIARRRIEDALPEDRPRSRPRTPVDRGSKPDTPGQRKRPPVPAFPLVGGLFHLLWLVQDSNLGRLRRRIYSQPSIKVPYRV